METSKLTGAALDWAVAKCEGVINGDDLDIGFILERGYTPSTDWAQGGAIIEREKINLSVQFYGWVASHGKYRNREMNQPFYTQKDITPLIAAMQCYVCSKMGDDIEIPEELNV